MDSTVKWILIGVGGYLLYEYFAGSGSVAALPPGLPPPGSGVTPPGVKPPGVTPPTPAPVIHPAVVDYTSLMNATVTQAVNKQSEWDQGTIALNGLLLNQNPNIHAPWFSRPVPTASATGFPVMSPANWAHYYQQVSGHWVDPLKLGLGPSVNAKHYFDALKGKGLSALRASPHTTGITRASFLNRQYMNQVTHERQALRRHIADKNYWDGQRVVRQMPYRWVN